MADPSMNSSSNATTQLPPPLVLWAQRRDRVLLTVQLENCKEPSITLKDSSLHFKGKGGFDNSDHEVLIEFNGTVDPDASKYAVTGRGVNFKVMKSDESSSFWPRLLKDSKKVHWLKTDFDKWVDEDDSDAEAAAGGDNEDFNLEDMMQSMGGLQGGAGMPGADDGEEDSDDEELPDLEGST